MDRSDERFYGGIGRKAAYSAGKAGKGAQNPTMARVEATVVKVNGDGTVDVNFGSSDNPKTHTIRMTTACSGVQAGDRVIVDTLDHISYVTGVLASSADFLLPSADAIGTWTDSATASSVEARGYKDLEFDYAGVFSQLPAVIPILGTIGATNANYGSISLNIVNRTRSSCTVRVHNSGTGTVSPTIRVWAFGLLS